MDNVGAPAEKDLSLSVSGVKHRCVSRDFVREQVVVQLEDVKSRIWCMPRF